MLNVLMIGKVKAVRRVELDGFLNGEWVESLPKVEITVESEIPDDNGDINYSMDKQVFEATEYSKYKALEHKHVAVPYVLETTKKGQKWYADTNMPIFELKDSLVNLIQVNKEVKK